MFKTKAFLAAVSIASLAVSQSSAIAGTCGPNSVIPEEYIPNNPLFEPGCAAHDACLDDNAPCRTVGACAALRDAYFYTSCEATYDWYNPARYACYVAAAAFSKASDAGTCLTGQGCLPSTKVGKCTEDGPLEY